MKPTYGNCIQQTCYALLRGFGDRLVVLRSRSRVWPIHLAIEFDRKLHPWSRVMRSHVSHWAFETTYGDETYAPWWFVGRWKKIDTQKVCDRRIVTLSPAAGIAFTVALVALLMLPWCVAWALYQPLAMAWWTLRAVRGQR